MQQSNVKRSRSRTVEDIAIATGVPRSEVLRAAWTCGIGVVDSTSGLADVQAPRLLAAIAARRSATKSLEMEWNFGKRRLWLRELPSCDEAMVAVERVALAADAICVLSKKYETWAVRVMRNGCFVWLRRDRKDPARAFVITAYIAGLPTPGNHAPLPGPS
jgi:hypothetical protein